MKKRKLIVKQKVLVCIYSVLILALLVSCKKVIFDGGDKPLPTTPVTKAPTAAADVNPDDDKQSEQAPTSAPVQTATSTPVPPATEAPAPTSTPVPTSTPTPLPPTPTPGPITVAEAKALLLDEIGAGYEAEHTGAVDTAGAGYYLFTVSDDAHTYTPQIAVNVKSKEIFYYYSQDEIVEFANFPPDNLESAGGEESGSQEDDGFTSQDAVALLNGLSATDLGLPATLSEYTILVDEWTTMVYGLECYCVNAYAELENRKQLMGVYFVAVDGSAAYRSDMGDFVLIY